MLVYTEITKLSLNSAGGNKGLRLDFALKWPVHGANYLFNMLRCMEKLSHLEHVYARGRENTLKFSGWYLRKSRVQIPDTIHLRERASGLLMLRETGERRVKWTRNSSSRGEKLFFYLHLLLNCGLKAKEWIWARPSSV